MFKKLGYFNDFVKDWYNPVEYDLKPYYKILNEINDIKINALSDNELKSISRKLKQQAERGESEDKLLAEAFALVREASYRILGLYPFDVQIVAGIALHKGKIVEMQTGEGKTLAAVAPAYLNALCSKGVHILTFNDYLASRDAQWMGPVYEFLGLKAGYISEGMSIEKRQEAYSCDITYVTAKESGFDKCWADYLDYISYVQEGIHLVSLGNRNPLDEFQRIAVETYENMLMEIDSEIVDIFNRAKADENGVVLDDEILKGPSSTWTYLMNDSPDQFSRLPFLVKAASTYVKGTLFSVRSIF